MIKTTYISNNILVTEYRNKNKQLHRLDGPAVERADGTKFWFVSDKRHRLDGPAVEWWHGGKEWWVNEKRHRLDGPAIEHPEEYKAWFIDGERHRLDGPAVEWWDGRKEWWVNEKRHRLDGPAIESVDGDKSWYIYYRFQRNYIQDATRIRAMNALLKLTILQNKSKKFNEWLFDPDHYAGKWHKKNMLRDFQDS